MLLGAFLQTLLIILPISSFYVITPTLTLLAIRLINTMLITYEVIPNPYLQSISAKKTTVQLPDLDGEFGKSGSEKIAVLLLGAKSNHPLGIFAPDFKTVGGLLSSMTKELENDPQQDSGFLGQTGFTRKAENGANEFVMISYWRSLGDVHRYAHGETHRDAWRWWEKTIKSHNYIGFMHEVYEADKGMWEGVYINFQPTLAGVTTILKKDGKLVGGEVGDQWISPLLEAKGELRTSNGRRGMKDKKEVVETMFRENVYV